MKTLLVFHAIIPVKIYVQEKEAYLAGLEQFIFIPDREGVFIRT